LFVSAEFAKIIHKMVGGKSKIVNKDAVIDDPQRRKPDITRAKEQLDWQPVVSHAFETDGGNLELTSDFWLFLTMIRIICIFRNIHCF